MSDITCPSTTRVSRLTIAVRNSTPWCSKAFFAILDQGFISGSNFTMGILLARWLGAPEYGEYALAFAIFVLLSLIYQSLLLEPMTVFGPSSYRHKLQDYMGTLIWIHCALAFITFVAMGSGAWVMTHFPRVGGLPSALIGAATAAPCVLLFWLARRVFYLKLASSQAAAGAILYSITLFGLLAYLHSKSLVSPMAAFVIMAIASLGTSTYLLLRFRPRFSRKTANPLLRKVVHENWTYGRWALAGSIFIWVPWNIFYTIVASFSGMADSGQLRALLNFALPMAQTYGAFSLLFIPHASELNEDKGWDAVRVHSQRVTLLFIAGGLAYWGFVCIFRTRLIQFLYGGQYSGIQHLLPTIAIASLLWGAAQGPAIALRARKTPNAVFWMYLVAAIVAVLVGVPATMMFGLTGAVAAILLASGTAWITGLYQMAKPLSACLRQAA